MPLIPKEDWEVALKTLHAKGFYTTKSDYSRYFATALAMLACEGMVTTKELDGSYGDRWRLTAKGLDRLENPHAYQ